MSAAGGTSRWDGPLTVVLGLLLLAAAAYAFVAAGLSAFIADSCADVTCDYPRFDAGLLIALVGQPVALVAATVGAFVLQARGRKAFVAPLIGFVVVAASLLGGLAITYSAVPGSSLF